MKERLEKACFERCVFFGKMNSCLSGGWTGTDDPVREIQLREALFLYAGTCIFFGNPPWKHAMVLEGVQHVSEANGTQMPRPVVLW